MTFSCSEMQQSDLAAPPLRPCCSPSFRKAFGSSVCLWHEKLLATSEREGEGSNREADWMEMQSSGGEGWTVRALAAERVELQRSADKSLPPSAREG